MSLEKSPDDEAAEQAAAWRRWRDAYERLLPELWMVLRHNGRTGQPWRVVFQSRSKAEAEEFYRRKVFPKRKNPHAFTYAATELYQGGLTWDCKRSKSGDAPFDGKTPFAIEGELKAAHAREEREARRAKRGRKRIAAPPQETNEVPAGVIAYEAFRRTHPATRVEKGYYTHPLVPGEAFTTAKAATKHAHAVHLATLRVVVAPAVEHGLRIAVGAPVEAGAEDAAEREALAEVEAGSVSDSATSYRTGSASPLLAATPPKPVSSRP